MYTRRRGRGRGRVTPEVETSAADPVDLGTTMRDTAAAMRDTAQAAHDAVAEIRRQGGNGNTTRKYVFTVGITVGFFRL